MHSCGFTRQFNLEPIFRNTSIFFSSKGCFILSYPFPTVPYQNYFLWFIKAYLTRGSFIRIIMPIFFKAYGTDNMALHFKVNYAILFINFNFLTLQDY